MKSLAAIYDQPQDFPEKWRVKRWISESEWQSGNKWFKLMYNTMDAAQKGYSTIVSLGGPWSNHLVALSECAQQEGFKAIGLIRGSWHSEQPTESMLRMQANGMELHCLDTALYDLRGSEDFKVWLNDHYPNAYYVPEGGSNYLGLMGCMEMLSADDLSRYTDFAVAGGTGTTAAAILLKTESHQKVHVYFALKANEDELRNMVRQLLGWVVQDPAVQSEYLQRLVIHADQTWGGYGKIKEELVQWMQTEREKGRTWDRVYTAKMVHALMQPQQSDLTHKSLLILHTGGIQGNASLSLAHP
jgi:1-aminocyclopropane-1-carboxylate deaminase